MNLSILLLEDDRDKADSISEAATSVPGVDVQDLVVVSDVAQAKRLLIERRFDALLLDLIVPPRAGESALRDGGVRLLREIISSGSILRPRFIVGITAYSEIAEEFERDFADHLFGLVTFDRASSGWRSTIRNLLGHIVASNCSAAGVDLCVVCALEAPELQSVLRLPWNWSPMHSDKDSANYYKGSVECRGLRRHVVAVAAPQMGMPAAALATTKAICQFSPRYVAMSGILAGFASRSMIGDAVVADTSWDYGSGKVRSVRKGEVEFLPEPTQIPLDPLLRSQLKQLALDVHFLASVRNEWQGPKPHTALNMRFGPVASGAAVIAASKIGEAVASQHRKVVGLDMETFAVYFSAMHAAHPRPCAFSVKAVCDLADEAKSDDFQAYASYVSANIIGEWARRFL